MPLNGIDVSSHQADLDVAAVPADFVIIKASEGATYRNTALDKHWDQAKAAGRLVGLYHFAGSNAPVAEADWFVDCIAGKTEALLVLDWERDPIGDVAWVAAWLERVRARTGLKAAVYMSEWPAANHDWSRVGRAGHPLWVAKYADNTADTGYDMTTAGPRPVVPTSSWPDGYAIWQWTSRGRLPGYAGYLDLNEARLTPEEWRSLAGVDPWDADVAVVNRRVTSLAGRVTTLDRRADAHDTTLAALDGRVDDHDAALATLLQQTVPTLLSKITALDADLTRTRGELRREIDMTAQQVDTLTGAVAQQREQADRDRARLAAAEKVLLAQRDVARALEALEALR